MKETLNWFSHDNDALENARMQALLATYGFEGYGRFWALNERIAKAKGAVLDLSTKVLKGGLAAHLRMTPADLDAFLAFLADPEECGLIHYENGRVTTDRTQKDLAKAMEERKRDSVRRKGTIDYQTDEPDGTSQKPAGNTEKPAGKTHTLQDTTGSNPQGVTSVVVSEAEFKSSAGAREAPPPDSTKPSKTRPTIVLPGHGEVASGAEFVKLAFEAKNTRAVPDFDPEPPTPSPVAASDTGGFG